MQTNNKTKMKETTKSNYQANKKEILKEGVRGNWLTVHPKGGSNLSLSDDMSCFVFTEWTPDPTRRQRDKKMEKDC